MFHVLLYVTSLHPYLLLCPEGKRELVVLLSLSSWCLVIVVWLFLAVPWVRLQFVIVVFPVHTHLLFYRPGNAISTNCVSIITLIKIQRRELTI